MSNDQDKGVSHPPSPELFSYLQKTFGDEDPPLRQIRAQAAQHQLPAIHVGALDGRLLTFFAKAIRAQRIVEIGTLAGYSAVCLARGLQPGGQVWTFEKSPQHAALARQQFENLRLTQTIELREGDALHNLCSWQPPLLDMVFIDADKTGYIQYFEWAVPHLREGGLILADNTLAWGQVYREEKTDAATAALRAYNVHVANDPRVFSTMIVTGEGLTISTKC